MRSYPLSVVEAVFNAALAEKLSNSSSSSTNKKSAV